MVLFFIRYFLALEIIILSKSSFNRSVFSIFNKESIGVVLDITLCISHI